MKLPSLSSMELLFVAEVISNMDNSKIGAMCAIMVSTSAFYSAEIEIQKTTDCSVHRQRYRQQVTSVQR